jgi:hypothetical protein
MSEQQQASLEGAITADIGTNAFPLVTSSIQVVCIRLLDYTLSTV